MSALLVAVWAVHVKQHIPNNPAWIEGHEYVPQALKGHYSGQSVPI